MKIWKYILPLYFGWIVSLLFMTFFGLGTLAHTNGATTQLLWPSSQTDYWIRWANWDGGHFRGIAENGYLPIQTVFFPAYPLLITILYHLGLPSLWAGLLISQICTILSLFFLYKLCLLDFNEQIAKTATFGLLIFPTSFYLAAVYSESLFLAAVLGSFYYARKKKWLFSAVIAAIAISTRLVGISLLIALICDYLLINPTRWSFPFKILNQKKVLLYLLAAALIYHLTALISHSYHLLFLADVLRNIETLLIWIAVSWIFIKVMLFLYFNLNIKKILSLNFLYLICSIIPLPMYMIYLNNRFKNPISFLTNEESWHRSFTLPWISVFSHINSLFFNGIFNLAQSPRTIIELGTFLICLIILIKNIGRIHLPYLIFAILAIIIPLFSGTLIAIHRYILVAFPMYIIFANIRNEAMQRVVIIFSTGLLAILAVSFINHYWVT